MAQVVRGERCEAGATTALDQVRLVQLFARNGMPWALVKRKAVEEFQPMVVSMCWRTRAITSSGRLTVRMLVSFFGSRSRGFPLRR
jgi:hypothetical protein